MSSFKNRQAPPIDKTKLGLNIVDASVNTDNNKINANLSTITTKTGYNNRSLTTNTAQLFRSKLLWSRLFVSSIPASPPVLPTFVVIPFAGDDLFNRDSASINVGGFTEFRFTFTNVNSQFPASPAYFLINPTVDVPAVIPSGSTAVMVGNGNVTGSWVPDVVGSPPIRGWRFGATGADLGSSSFNVPAGGTFLTLTFSTAPFPPGTSVQFNYFSG
jgi:hypothetical protein